MVSTTTSPTIERERQSSSALEPRYHLVLLDDNDHTYAYVVILLGHVLGYSREKAYALACVVDSEGRAIVETAGHYQVTRHQRQIHAFGADPLSAHSAGSMSAIVEPAR